MQINNRNYLIAAAVLLAAFFLVFHLEKASGRAVSSKHFSEFPLKIGNWSGEDLPLAKRVYEILQTDDVVARGYRDNQGNSIILIVVYSQDNRAAFHPPEICYLGGGTELLDRKVESLPLADQESLKVNTLKMQDKERQTKAWYWFATRSRFTHNYYLQQLNILFDWFKHKAKEGALIRVSTNLDKNNPEASEAAARQFISSVTPVIKAFLKST